MQNLKRASIGGYVRADVTGLGEWLVGRITSFNDTSVTFQPADGSELVKMARFDVFKATKAEFDDVFMERVEQEAETQQQEIIDLELLEDCSPKNGVVNPDRTKQYQIGITAFGRKSRHSGDAVAKLLEGKDLADVISIVAKETGMKCDDLASRWDHLNHGMQRMNLGNLLRRHLEKSK